MSQQSVNRSRSWLRARCTRDFMPDVDRPSRAPASAWVRPSRSVSCSASRYVGDSRASSGSRQPVSSPRRSPGSSRSTRVGLVDRGRIVDRHFPAGCGPVVVGDRVAADRVDPAADRVDVADLVGVAVQPQHHLLQDVFGAGPVRHPPGDEPQQRIVQVPPHRLHRRIRLVGHRRAQRHPQPTASVQQPALSSAAQHVSCSTGEQHADSADRNRLVGLLRGDRVAGEEALQVVRQLIGPVLDLGGGLAIHLPKNRVDDQLHRRLGVFTPAEHPDATVDVVAAAVDAGLGAARALPQLDGDVDAVDPDRRGRHEPPRIGPQLRTGCAPYGPRPPPRRRPARPPPRPIRPPDSGPCHDTACTWSGPERGSR